MAAHHTPPRHTACGTASLRRAKGGVKAHVLLDHDDYLPRYVLITEAKRSDVKMADAFTLNPGSIVAMDRGYNDYGLFFRWTTEEIYFVTRLKENAAYEVVKECEVALLNPPLRDALPVFEIRRLTAAAGDALKFRAVRADHVYSRAEQRIETTPW